MPNSALCIGLTYPNSSFPSSPSSTSSLPPLPGASLDATTLSTLATSMGYATVTELSDARDADGLISKQDILDHLAHTLAQADPGDQVLLAISAHGGVDPITGENVVWAGDGRGVSGREVAEVIGKAAGEGVTVTLVLDTSNSGAFTNDLVAYHETLNLDPSLSAGAAGGTDVVCIGATAAGEVAASSEAGGTFTNALAQVLADNPGVAWIDAIPKVDILDGKWQDANVVTTNVDALYKPLSASNPIGALAGGDSNLHSQQWSPHASLYESSWAGGRMDVVYDPDMVLHVSSSTSSI